ncbi:hypothetical protein GH153_03015 [bacterium]|nr:hypothetical protein [bacterium]
MTRDKMNEAIEDLKGIRQKYSLTAHELSVALKTSERNIWRWLGNNNIPSPQTIISIKKFVQSFKEKKQKEEIAEIEKCMPLLMAMIYDGNYDFSPLPKVGEASIVCKQGRLRKVITLLQCAEVTGKRVADLILPKVIEAIARRGLIQILSLQLDRRMSNEDIKFWLDTGEGKREIPSNVITPKRLFKDKAIKADEIKEGEQGGHLILDITKQITSMRQGKKKSYEARFGAVSDMEQKLHREAVLDDFNQRNKQQEMIDTLKKYGKYPIQIE